MKFGEATESDTESFHDAPTDRKATSQLQLVQYARKMPGRLASRLLLKMKREGAQGYDSASSGALPADGDEPDFAGSTESEVTTGAQNPVLGPRPVGTQHRRQTCSANG